MQQQVLFLSIFSKLQKDFLVLQIIYFKLNKKRHFQWLNNVLQCTGQFFIVCYINTKQWLPWNWICMNYCKEEDEPCNPLEHVHFISTQINSTCSSIITNLSNVESDFALKCTAYIHWYKYWSSIDGGQQIFPKSACLLLLWIVLYITIISGSSDGNKTFYPLTWAPSPFSRATR